jgi:hypothetical protein
MGLLGWGKFPAASNKKEVWHPAWARLEDSINTAHTKQHQHRANQLPTTHLTGIRNTSDSSSWFELDFRRYFIPIHLIVKVNLSLGLLGTTP